jgi:hypothetical protein
MVDPVLYFKRKYYNADGSISNGTARTERP